MKRLLGSSGLATIASGLAAIVSLASNVMAADYFCPGPIPATIDNVIVTGECMLDNLMVKGSVQVGLGGAVISTRSTIVGNVLADGAELVEISSTFVRGDIQIRNVVFTSSNVFRGNVIGGNLQAFNNFSASPIIISDNVVAGNLECESNFPLPNASGNSVIGNSAGQCDTGSALPPVPSDAFGPCPVDPTALDCGPEDLFTVFHNIENPAARPATCACPGVTSLDCIDIPGLDECFAVDDRVASTSGGILVGVTDPAGSSHISTTYCYAIGRFRICQNYEVAH